MAEVKVKVVEGFNDREDNLKYKEKESILAVTEERAKKLEGLGLIKRVKESERTEKNDVEKKG